MKALAVSLYEEALRSRLITRLSRHHIRDMERALPRKLNKQERAFMESFLAGAAAYAYAMGALYAMAGMHSSMNTSFSSPPTKRSRQRQSPRRKKHRSSKVKTASA
jgi:hypothetical protein